MPKHRARFIVGKGGKALKEKPKRGSGKRKKPYVRPEVKQVPLRPEEAVLGGCKTSGSNGPSGAGDPNNCGFPLYCSLSGS